MPVYRGIGVRARAGSADGSRGSGSAAAAPTSSSTAPRGCGACMWSRCRAPARSMSSGISTRRSAWWSKAAARPKSGRKARRKKHVFEWQKGSLFAIPLNAFHRIVNASSSPALMLCGTSAPNVMNLIDNPELHLQLPAQLHRAVLGRRGFLQAQRRRRARSDPRARHAPHEFRPRHRQHRAAARQPPLARLPPRRAADGQQPLLCLDRRARDRPLFQGAQAPVGRGADLRQGQGLHLHVAGGARHAARGRTARPTRCCARTTSRSVSSRRRRWRRLVPPAFRRQQGGAAHHRLARPEQSARAAGPAVPASSSWTTARSTSTRAAARSPITRRTRRSARSSRSTLAREGVKSRMNPEFYERPPGEGEEVMGDVM